MIDHTPQPQDAIAVVKRVTGSDVTTIERFATGLAHWVYDVRTADGQQLVARLTRPVQRWMFEGALFWYEQLVPLDVPLPKLIHVDLGDGSSFPVMLMERLPGTDLGNVYLQLDQIEKRRLAERIAAIQQRIATLPLGSGFGYGRTFDDSRLKPTWKALIENHLDRSAAQIAEAGVVDRAVVDRVRDRLDVFGDLLATVEPRCFLDDTTTKNVIVHHGALSGIVDVDQMCFGDQLYTVALTRMSLLARDWPIDYVEAWCNALDLHADQQRLLDLYTAIFCVDFLSEQGQQFNKDAPPHVDQAEVQRLSDVLDRLLIAL